MTKEIPLIDTAALDEAVKELGEAIAVLRANQYASEQGPPEEDPEAPTDYESVTHGY
jgi:hypothetical protein